MSDIKTEGNTVDPIEYGRLLHAVETIAKQMERWPQLETGLQKANQDIMFLKHSQGVTESKIDDLIVHVKHLNGTDDKLQRLGFRLEEAPQHRADNAWLRQQRLIAENRAGIVSKVKTSMITALAMGGGLWILSTLWAARHTLAG